MTNKRRYLYMNKGDNEWLADKPPTDPEDLKTWNEDWRLLREECPHEIEITEDMYSDAEYGEIPEWIDVTIFDEGVLEFKMLEGVLGAFDGASSMSFNKYFDIDVSPEWGGWTTPKLEVGKYGAFVTFYAKHSSEQIEINVTQQFNQAIGKE